MLTVVTVRCFFVCFDLTGFVKPVAASMRLFVSLLYVCHEGSPSFWNRSRVTSKFPSRTTKCGRVRQTVAMIAGHHAQQAAERKIGELTMTTVSCNSFFVPVSMFHECVDRCVSWDDVVCGIFRDCRPTWFSQPLSLRCVVVACVTPHLIRTPMVL